jgi:hypothetical protein
VAVAGFGKLDNDASFFYRRLRGGYTLHGLVDILIQGMAAMGVLYRRISFP